MRFADDSRGRPFAKDPAVVRFDGRYFLYYTMAPFGDGRPGDGFGTGIATSEDLEHWEKVGELRPAMACEARGRCAPGAIVLDGKVHLFYQTYGNGPKDAICHAVSTDGIHFERNPENPILGAQGDWNNGRAIDADVLAIGGKLFLYFATRDPEGRVQMLGVASAPLDSGFGREAWTHHADEGSILKPELPWEQECIEAPATCTREGRHFLFYAGAYNNAPQQVGVAVSDDGIHWRRLSDKPFLANGAPDAWNACESGHPYLFTDDDGRTHLFYQGNNDMGKSWYLSRVEVLWKNGVPYLD